MSTKQMEALFDRAKTIDILSDDVAELLDAAAQQGAAELVETSRILNSRGLKIGILREYGERQRKFHALKQREWREKADEQLLREVYGPTIPDCLK